MADFNVRFTEEQQRQGAIEYNYRREAPAGAADTEGPVAEVAAMAGTDAATFRRERPGLSAFALEDGVVYHTYSTYARRRWTPRDGGGGGRHHRRASGL